MSVMITVSGLPEHAAWFWHRICKLKRAVKLLSERDVSQKPKLCMSFPFALH